MAKSKEVIEPADAVKSGVADSPAAPVIVTPPPPAPKAQEPQPQPAFDENDFEAAHPGESPKWPNDYFTFKRQNTTPKELILKDGSRFIFEAEQISTANRYLAAKLFALDPHLGVQRVPNPKENPYARK